MIDWRRNLGLLWVCQVLSLMGFSFALPFMPLYIQELGITDPEALRLWSGLLMAGSGVSLAIMTPIWGVLSDRFGRKPMTLRANLGGAVLLFAMGLVRSPELLLVLRVVQGALTGTVIANLTLVVSNTPEKRIGFAIGIMNSAVFAGNAVGPLVGGYFADQFGFRVAFFLSSITLFLAFFIALFWVREDFSPEAASSSQRFFKGLVRLTTEQRILPIIGLFVLFGMARFSPRPMYPLLVERIAAAGLGIATQAGLINATAGVAAVLAGIVVGRRADRGRPLVIGMICAVAAGLFLMPQGFLPSVWSLIPFVFFADFASAGIDPIMNVILSRQVPVERRGTAFGLSGSARSIGWSMGAMLGGGLAAYLDFAAVFINSALLFFLIAFFLSRLHRRGTEADITARVPRPE
ncbi:MAG: MFS transporter [Spirochaetaceae bacterium]|nr:MAG: MFS transporter [Spirochaetaceae bacterium]